MVESELPSSSVKKKSRARRHGFSGTIILLFEESDGLHAGNFEPFATTHVLTGHEVVTANHIGLSLGELGAIAIVGAGRKLLLFAANQPAEFIFASLPAVGTSQIGHAGFRPFIKEVTFFHCSVAPNRF
jgi:hypothetical protein